MVVICFSWSCSCLFEYWVPIFFTALNQSNINIMNNMLPDRLYFIQKSGMGTFINYVKVPRERGIGKISTYSDLGEGEGVKPILT